MTLRQQHLECDGQSHRFSKRTEGEFAFNLNEPHVLNRGDSDRSSPVNSLD